MIYCPRHSLHPGHSGRLRCWHHWKAQRQWQRRYTGFSAPTWRQQRGGRAALQQQRQQQLLLVAVLVGGLAAPVVVVVVVVVPAGAAMMVHLQQQLLLLAVVEVLRPSLCSRFSLPATHGRQRCVLVTHPGVRAARTVTVSSALPRRRRCCRRHGQCLQAVAAAVAAHHHLLLLLLLPLLMWRRPSLIWPHPQDLAAQHPAMAAAVTAARAVQ